MKTYFPTNPSFGLVETDFLSRRNSVLLFRAFFLLLETIIEIMSNQFEQSIFFLLVETSLSTNASFRVAETDFLASTNHKLFFRLVQTYFLTNPSFQLWENYFLYSRNRLLYLRVLSYQPKPSLICVETIS